MDTQTDRQTHEIARGLASVGLRPDYIEERYHFIQIHNSRCVLHGTWHALHDTMQLALLRMYVYIATYLEGELAKMAHYQ